MRHFKTLLITGVSVLVLWTQIASVRRTGVIDLPESSWRFWDDMTLAVARYVGSKSPKDSQEEEGSGVSALVGDYRDLVVNKIRNFAIQPTQFWRTVTEKQFETRLAPFSEPPNEDPGRARLLEMGFRLRGGVAPYLLLWIAALAFIPVLWAVTHAFVSNGLTSAAISFATLLAFSPYWIECLSLPHSAIGFYLAGLVALAAFAISVFMPSRFEPGHWKRVALRAALLTAVLLTAVWCRSGSIAFVPVAFAVVGIGFFRAGLPRLRAAGLAALLTLVPIVALRPHQVHNVWLPLWEGLGDFGTDRGYSWYDKDAGKFLATKGFPLRFQLRYVSAAEEAVFRKAFLDEISSSPVWYAKILAQRVVATAGLTHLSPYGPRDGESRKTPYFHYKYTTPVDWFGWGESHREVPVSVLYVPTVLLLVWGALSRGRMRAEMSVLAAVGIAALPIPLLISTASGLETQAFSLVYFLGAAFLVQRLTDTLKNRLERA